MPKHANLPSDWESPDWNADTFDWPRYAGAALQEVWPSFTPDQKKAVAETLYDLALMEGVEPW